MATSSHHFAQAALLSCLAGQLACDPLADGGSGDGDPAGAGVWSDPVVLVGGADQPTALGQDAQSLYWSDLGGFVRFVAKDGGAVTSLYQDVGATADLIVADRTIFWLEEGYGRLQSYSLDGEQAFTLAVGLDSPRQLAVDPSYVYWIDDAGIMRIPRLGGYTELLVASSDQDHFTDLAVDDTYLYYANRDRGIVASRPLHGGPELTWATGLSGLSEIAADGTFIYWSTATQISALDVTEPLASTETVTSGLNHPSWLTAAGGYLYFTSSTEGTVERVSKTGGNPETIARNQGEPRNVIVDTTAVYWLDHGHGDGTGSIRKVERR